MYAHFGKFGLVPKSIPRMTLKGNTVIHSVAYYAPACRSPSLKFEWRYPYTTSGGNVAHMDSSLWGYNVYADIRWGSLDRGHQIRVHSVVEIRKLQFFDFCGRYIFRNVIYETKVIMSEYVQARSQDFSWGGPIPPLPSPSLPLRSLFPSPPLSPFPSP